MKNKKNLAVLALLVVFIIVLSIMFFMGKTPQQPYSVISNIGSLEIKFYPKAILASVVSDDMTYRGSANRNFRKLAGYIFGGNQGNEKIAMTAPVHLDWSKGKSEMSFVMPEGYHLNNLPDPADSDVQLREAPEEYVAVLRFGGYASDQKIEVKKKELKQLLLEAGIKHENNFRFLGYNAPWDFLFRRNEIIVSISKSAADRLAKKK